MFDKLIKSNKKILHPASMIFSLNSFRLYDTTRMYEQNHNIGYSFLDFLLCFLENLRFRRNFGSICNHGNDGKTKENVSARPEKTLCRWNTYPFERFSYIISNFLDAIRM